MADTKISAYTGDITGATLSATDLFVGVDVSDTTMGAGGTTKKITAAELLIGLAAISSGVVMPTGLTLAAGTLTTDVNALSVTGTWNAAGVTFTGIKANFTNTASAAASLLADIQLGGASKFSVGITSSLLVGSRAANTVSISNGTTGQSLYLDNTYTDSSNYERGFMRWASNVLEIGTEVAGTGTARTLKIKAGHATRVWILDNNSNWNGGDGSVICSGYSATGNSYLPVVVPSSNNNTVIRISGAITQTDGGALLLYGKDHASRGSFSLQGCTLTADVTIADSTIRGVNAYASATTNLDGGSIYIAGGTGASGSAGDADGGHIYLDGGQGYGTGSHGGIYFANTRGLISFFAATAVAQQSGTGETAGFTAGAGTAVLDDSTFTGNVGSTAYRISDVVKALKNYGLLAA